METILIISASLLVGFFWGRNYGKREIMKRAVQVPKGSRITSIGYSKK